MGGQTGTCLALRCDHFKVAFLADCQVRDVRRGLATSSCGVFARTLGSPGDRLDEVYQLRHISVARFLSGVDDLLEMIEEHFAALGW